MKRPAKSYKLFSAVGVLALLILSFAGQAFADTKPKYVYVANSGDSFPGDQLETFQFTATATCTSSPCASTFTISRMNMTGIFKVDQCPVVFAPTQNNMTSASSISSVRTSFLS